MTDNKLTEVFRPSVTCLTWTRRSAQNTTQQLFAYFGNCEIQPMKPSLPSSLIKIGHGLPCIISARSEASQLSTSKPEYNWGETITELLSQSEPAQERRGEKNILEQTDSDLRSHTRMEIYVACLLQVTNGPSVLM